jgi:hypothetical protein
VGGDDDLAFEGAQPLLRHVHQRQALEGVGQRRAGLMLLREGIGGELGMAFPFQAEAAEVVIKILGVSGRPGHPEIAAECAQGRLLPGGLIGASRGGLDGDRLRVDREMGDGLGRIKLQERPRVGFGCKRHAQGMVQG